MMLAVALATAAAAGFGVAWWRARDEVGRLRAITDDDVIHSTYACRESRCSCAASAHEVRSAAARRRTHMTRLDVQDS